MGLPLVSRTSELSIYEYPPELNPEDRIVSSCLVRLAFCSEWGRLTDCSEAADIVFPAPSLPEWRTVGSSSDVSGSTLPALF